MKRSILIIIIIIVAILNFTPLSFLLKKNYSYSNFDRSFRFQEEGSGIDFNMAKTRYKWFLQDNQSTKNGDTTLYRTFTIKPWQVWSWRDYVLQHERFTLPYLDTNRVK
ncbi:hypothetical protein ACFQZI_00025 [Mucilaginibacter lutimaris]|uniref:Uncharacterized protein n=1 Tax=Mucilaginibacter lutimaris TaxID=931629 RepID=A0ABW2Z9F5_9SPHI